MRQFWAFGIFLIVLFSGVSKAYADLAFVFPIRTAKAETACSATYLKIGGVCRLVSDAHCRSGSLRAAGGAAEFEIGLGTPISVGHTHFGSAGFVALGRTKVLRSDPLYDLMELEVPAELISLCPRLTPTEIVSNNELVFGSDPGVRESQSLQIFGYVQGVPRIEVTRDIPHSVGYGSSVLRFERLSLDPFAVLIEADNLRLLPGMSGGPVVSNDRRLLGIAARFVPFQNRAYFTGVETLSHWLEQVAPADVVAGPELKSAWIASFQSPAGENGHAGGGENGHAGGGFIDRRFKSTEVLSLFREPQEGWPDSEGAGARTVLGLGKEQVDGWSDLQIKAARHEKANPIFREKDGFANAKVRSKIIQRLQGYYQPTFEGGASDQNHFIYVPNDHAVEGFDLESRGSDLVEIDIDPAHGGWKKRKMVISLHLWSHGLGDNRNLLSFTQMSENHIQFEVVPDSDWKNIELRQILPEEDLKKGAIPRALRCLNNGYLKLICGGPDMELSLSLFDTELRRLSYRFTMKVPMPPGQPGEYFVNYEFGRLRGTSQPGKFRKTFRGGGN